MQKLWQSRFTACASSLSQWRGTARCNNARTAMLH